MLFSQTIQGKMQICKGNPHFLAMNITKTTTKLIASVLKEDKTHNRYKLFFQSSKMRERMCIF